MNAGNTGIPRGIEVLVKKASVDPEFRTLLLSKRTEAAELIGLPLDPAEAMMLRAATDVQLEAIIARTTVPQEHRRAFLGKAAAAMLAAIGVMSPGMTPAGFAEAGGAAGGIMPDRPHPIPQPVREPASEPEPVEPPASAVERQVIAVVAKQLGVSEKTVSTDTPFGKDILADVDRHEEIRKALETQFRIAIPPKAFQKVRTVGDAVDYVETAVEIEPRVIGITAKHLKVGTEKVSRKASLAGDLGLSRLARGHLRKKLASEFHIHIFSEAFNKLQTVGDVIDLVGKAVRRREAAEQAADARKRREAEAAQRRRRPAPSPLSPYVRPGQPYVPPPPPATLGIRPDPPPRPGPWPRPGPVGGSRPDRPGAAPPG